MSANQSAGDVLKTIRPDLESFASLWSALRANYDGTNVTRIVARLLHMYQPENGVVAYERLLRTLYVLLEDFDEAGLRLLLSMVPPPKDVADNVLEEVFTGATGFVRINAPVFHRNNGIVAAADAIAGSEIAEIGKNVTPQLMPIYPARQQNIQGRHLGNIKCYKNATRSKRNKNDAPARNRKSPQMIQQDSDMFRGFPPNEISNTQSHVQNINHFLKPTNYGFAQSQAYVNFDQVTSQNSGQMHQSIIPPPNYRLKWLQAPYLSNHAYQATASYRDFYLKTMDNKYVRLPFAKLNGLHRTDFSCSSQAPCQSLHAQESLGNASIGATSNNLLDKLQRPNVTQESISKNVSCIKSDRDKQCSMTDTAFESKPATESTVSIESTDLDSCRIKNENEASSKSTAPDCSLPEIDSSNLEKVKTSTETVDKENELLNKEALKQFEQEVRKKQRAIQEDIFKMDVIRTEEDNYTSENTKLLEEDSLATSKKFQKCIQRFLKRMKSEECVDCPAFRRTRTLYEIRKPVFLYASSSIVTNCPINLKSSVESIAKTDVPTLKEDRKKLVCKKRSDPRSRSKSQRNTQRNLSHGQATQTNVKGETIEEQKNFETECKNKGDIDELPYRCSTTLSDLASTNLMQRASTMVELAAYKKQYYDALLSIQRAKAAVANSLAISSVGSSTGFDPYYYNYLRQQHQLLQQQQRLLMGSWFPPQKLLPFGLSSVHNAPNPWVRSVNGRYQPFGQFGLLQRPQELHSSSLYSPGLGSVSRDPEVTRPQHYVQNVHRQLKPSTKRRKLEEIVGKLKETESNCVSN